MKILHTADIHLQEYEDERWNSLKEILALGKKQTVDVLTICGDLFDSSLVAQKLRVKIRELFTGLPFPVLIIPGNHDVDAYPDGIFLGEQITVIRDLLTPVEINGAYFWGFPYEELMPEEILEYLHLAARLIEGGNYPDATETTHILLIHGELQEISNGWFQYGEEGAQRYLPVKLSYFRHLPWRYVLAGHLHSTFQVHQFRQNAYFVYCGSPVSVTRRETGVRQVNIFNLGEAPAPQPLPTPYYERMVLRLNPFLKENPLEIITEQLRVLPENATLLLEIEGYFNGKLLEMSEEEFHRALSKLVGRRMEIVRMEFRDIREIIEDDLFSVFMERLNNMELDTEEREEILQLTIQAMMEVGV